MQDGLVKMRFVFGSLIGFTGLRFPYGLISSCKQARFFFQQLLSGVSYCHSMVCRESVSWSLWTGCILVFF
jgi:serine/threonine protein kinase